MELLQEGEEGGLLQGGGLILKNKCNLVLNASFVSLLCSKSCCTCHLCQSQSGLEGGKGVGKGEVQSLS